MTATRRLTYFGALCVVLAMAFVVVPMRANAETSGKSAQLGTVVNNPVYSTSLGIKIPVSVYLPPGYPTPDVQYPVLYLLHGDPGSGSRLFQKMELNATVSKLIDANQVQPFIIVAPSDGPYQWTDSEWADSPMNSTWQWETAITTDLVGYVDSTYQACTNRSGRSIGGLSMGAFGAINTALHNLSVFSAATLWSPYFVANTPPIDGPVGTEQWFAESPLLYIKGIASELKTDPLAVSFYNSANDLFYPQDEAFAQTLTQLHVVNRFQTVEGPHTYALWNKYFAGELEWLSAQEHC